MRWGRGSSWGILDADYHGETIRLFTAATTQHQSIGAMTARHAASLRYTDEERTNTESVADHMTSVHVCNELDTL